MTVSNFDPFAQHACRKQFRTFTNVTLALCQTTSTNFYTNSRIMYYRSIVRIQISPQHVLLLILYSASLGVFCWNRNLCCYTWL